MIDFNLSINNPWSQRWRTMFFKNGLLPNHKAWEFNGYQTHQIVDVKFSLSFTGDHPGVFIMLGFVGYSIELSVYDTRHGDMR
jgi:hypothetical protein